MPIASMAGFLRGRCAPCLVAHLGICKGRGVGLVAAGRDERPPAVRRLTSGAGPSDTPGQGLPVSAALTQMTSVALGPESVKSAKKLSGRVGNTVRPCLTVLSVTNGNGISMFDFACCLLQDLTSQLEGDEREERRLAERHALDVVALVALRQQEPAEAVLGLAPCDRERLSGVDERLQDSVRAALHPGAVDFRQRRKLSGCRPLRGGGSPVAAVLGNNLDSRVAP